MVRRWCRQFTEGRQHVHVERSGRPYKITDDLVELVRESRLENRRFTITPVDPGGPAIIILAFESDVRGFDPNPSVASPTSQFILQPFFRFSNVTGSSLNFTWRAAHDVTGMWLFDVRVSGDILFQDGYPRISFGHHNHPEPYSSLYGRRRSLTLAVIHDRH